jgi:hypothetical protein
MKKIGFHGKVMHFDLVSYVEAPLMLPSRAVGISLFSHVSKNLATGVNHCNILTQHFNVSHVYLIL